MLLLSGPEDHSWTFWTALGSRKIQWLSGIQLRGKLRNPYVFHIPISMWLADKTFILFNCLTVQPGNGQILMFLRRNDQKTYIMCKMVTRHADAISYCSFVEKLRFFFLMRLIHGVNWVNQVTPPDCVVGCCRFIRFILEWFLMSWFTLHSDPR